MKKASLVLFILLFQLTVFSQRDTTAIIDDSIPKPTYRGEFGFNLIPVFAYFTGVSNNNYDPKYSILFKHWIGRKGMIRTSFSYQPGVSLLTTPSPYYSSYVNDTVRIDYMIDYSEAWTCGAKAGWEFVGQRKRVSLFYGMDLYFKHNQSASYSYNDSIMEITHGSSYAVPGLYDSLMKINVNGWANDRINYAGWSIYFGMKIPISKKIMFSFQIGYDLPLLEYGKWSFKDAHSNEYNNSFNNFLRFSYYQFEGFHGIMNDFSIVYKF